MDYHRYHGCHRCRRFPSTVARRPTYTPRSVPLLISHCCRRTANYALRDVDIFNYSIRSFVKNSVPIVVDMDDETVANAMEIDGESAANFVTTNIISHDAMVRTIGIRDGYPTG